MTVAAPLCIYCKFLKNWGACDAFPDSIPPDILGALVDHTKPMFGQKNKIVFKRGNQIDTSKRRKR